MVEDYLLANARIEAGTRFEALSALFDDRTVARIKAVGIEAGWRCWEVGSGGATIPNRLAALVGAGGRVIATDIDTTWADRTDSPGIEVRRHDVATEPPPWRDLDLVHARLVLVHIPDRDRALRHIVDALRPGGWLVIEDADPALQPLACPDACGPEQMLANDIRSSFRSLMKDRGVDLAYGRKLPRLLREVGLVDVAAEAFFPVSDPAGALLERATIEMLEEQIVATGLASADQVSQHLANIKSGRLDLTTAPMVTAWGRKPYRRDA